MCTRDDWVVLSKYSSYCKVHRHPFASHGNASCPNMKESGFTSNSQAITSDLRGVHDLKRKYVKKVKDSIFERFHSYGVKFEADINWEALFKHEEIHLRNNVSYKRIDFDKGIVKVFKKSILVTLRTKSEIVGLSVREAELKSKQYVNNILDLLPKSIQVKNRDVVSLHNAFVNHPNAKREVNVTIEGEKRFISDNSKGYSEFEAIHPKLAVSDSEAIEQDIVSLVDKGLSRDVLAQSIHALIKDREYYAENLRSHVEAIQTLSESVKELKEVVKKERKKNLLTEWW